jgi:hypothetical protein
VQKYTIDAKLKTGEKRLKNIDDWEKPIKEANVRTGLRRRRRREEEEEAEEEEKEGEGEEAEEEGKRKKRME